MLPRGETKDKIYEETQVISDLWGVLPWPSAGGESQVGVARITGQRGCGNASGVSLDFNREQRLGRHVCGSRSTGDRLECV